MLLCIAHKQNAFEDDDKKKQHLITVLNIYIVQNTADYCKVPFVSQAQLLCKR